MILGPGPSSTPIRSLPASGRQVLVALLLGTSAAGLWLAWPWLVPLVSPVPTSSSGSDLVVVLDGDPGRFAAADRIGHALPQPPSRLLIRCPRGTLPPQPSPPTALGSQGIRVGPADWPAPSSAERRKLFRDALRLTLWRATGSTCAWLAPKVVARKRADFGV